MHREAGGAVTLTALLAVTACGGGDAAPAAKGPQPLRMTDLDLQRGPAEAVQGDRRRVPQGPPAGRLEITFDPIPFENYTTTLTTQIAGGNPPDLAWILENSAPDFVGSGALAPLEEQDREGPDELATSPPPEAVAARRRAVRLPVLHLAVRRVRQHRPGQGRRAEDPARAHQGRPVGLGARQRRSTRPSRGEGKPGLTILDFDYKGWDNLATIWSGWGAKAWSDDGATCQFNSPEMVEAMTFVHKAIFTDKAMPGRAPRPTSSRATRDGRSPRSPGPPC